MNIETSKWIEVCQESEIDIDDLKRFDHGDKTFCIYHIKDGFFDANSARALGRLGYMNYGVVGKENIVSKNRPQLDENGNLKPIEEWDGKYR